jgi:hypothetical protein
MGDTNMDKEPELIDYNDVDSDGNPIEKKSALDNEDQANLEENESLTYDSYIPKPPPG